MFFHNKYHLHKIHSNVCIYSNISDYSNASILCLLCSKITGLHKQLQYRFQSQPTPALPPLPSLPLPSLPLPSLICRLDHPKFYSLPACIRKMYVKYLKLRLNFIEISTFKRTYSKFIRCFLSRINNCFPQSLLHYI